MCEWNTDEFMAWMFWPGQGQCILQYIQFQYITLFIHCHYFITTVVQSFISQNMVYCYITYSWKFGWHKILQKSLWTLQRKFLWFLFSWNASLSSHTYYQMIFTFLDDVQYQIATTMMESSFVEEAMVRGYRVYKGIWTATVGKVLTCQRFNPADPFDVAVGRGLSASITLERSLQLWWLPEGSCKLIAVLLEMEGNLLQTVNNNRKLSSSHNSD